MPKDKKDLNDSSFHILKTWYGLGLRLIFEGAFIGAITGLIIVFFRYAVDKIEGVNDRLHIYLSGKPWLIVAFFFVLIVISVLLGYLIKKEPMIRGSGIPQVEGVLLRKIKMSWWRVVLGKLVGGILSIGSGLSLGREGPSVQIGAAIGQGYSSISRRMKTHESFYITSGASAGLAAAFNAPLAGVMFALEEVHKSFSPLILLSAVSASISADFVSKEFFGLKPIFQFKAIPSLPLKYYYYLLVIGVILGLFGAFFNFMLIKTKDLFVRQKVIPVQLRPFIPFIGAGILGFFYPQVLGGGNNLITSLTQENFAIKLLAIFLLLKFVFTIISYASGVPGGIFLPLLVIGAITGNIFGIFISKVFNFDPALINNLIVLAMAGYFSAIVRAPITGIILITEMTGSLVHILPLSIVAFTAYVITNLLGSEPIYESLLKRSLQNEEYSAYTRDSKSKIMLEIPVIVGSELDNKKIKDIYWPEDCLLVGIRRGSEEKIPRGNTSIFPGDYLIVLVAEENFHSVREEIRNLSGHAEITILHQHYLLLKKIPGFVSRLLKYKKSKKEK